MADHGEMLSGETAWAFLMQSSHLFPRSDVLGFRNDGDDEMLALKHLDFDSPYDVFAYRQPSDHHPFVKLTALVTIDRAQFPERLYRHLRCFDSPGRLAQAWMSWIRYSAMIGATIIARAWSLSSDGPNVGKSTLINAIIGQKIAIVTAKPQTTRQRQLGIHTTRDAQILFVDTPGIHEPHSRLGEYMVKAAHFALRDADVIFWIVDISQAPKPEDLQISQLLGRMARNTPVLLVLNKCDMVGDAHDRSAYLGLAEYQASVETSATRKRGIDELMACLLPLLPPGPRYYPAEQVSETNLRFLAGETIREKVIELTSEEIPYSVAVEITEFREMETITHIDAVIYVERESQKGILIGKRGSMIKRIGVDARVDLEKLTATRVNLETRVKVLKNWRSNEQFLRRVGYGPAQAQGRLAGLKIVENRARFRYIGAYLRDKRFQTREFLFRAKALLKS